MLITYKEQQYKCDSLMIPSRRYMPFATKGEKIKLCSQQTELPYVNCGVCVINNVLHTCWHVLEESKSTDFWSLRLLLFLVSAGAFDDTILQEIKRLVSMSATRSATA
jgi:hypothetical protein